MPDSSGTYWFILLLLFYVASAIWMGIHLPAAATPNELLNFEYVQVMRQIRGLPNRGLVDSEIRYTEWHQPPIYFAFAALTGLSVPVPAVDMNPPPPIKWPGNPAYLATHSGNLNPVIHVTPQNTPLLYTSRFAATLLGVLGLAALYRAGRDVYSAPVALLITSILAFQPNYLHLSASVNNDMPLTAVSAMVLAYTILIIHNDMGPRWFFGLGLLAAAAVLTKANGIFVLAYLAAACMVVLLRHRDWPQAIKSGLYSLAGLIPLWSAWLALNTVRMKDTLGVEGSLPVNRVLALRPADFALLKPWLDDIGRSFWLDWSAGDVGYGPAWYYILWVVLLLFGLLGWLQRDRRKGSWRITLAVVLGMAAISYLYLAVKALTVREGGFMVPEGRWWLPIMPGIAWLSAAGFARWWPPARRDQALLTATLLPVCSTLLLLIFFFPALYPQARRLPDSSAADLDKAVIYGDQLALLEASVDPLTLGREGRLMLTWQAVADIDTDYTIATQLLIPTDRGWQKIDEQYSYPGLGLNPTSGWRKGDVYQDSWTLLPQGTATGPTLAWLLVHVQQAGTNLEATAGGQQVDPPLVLSVPVRPQEPLAAGSPLSEAVSFGGLFELTGIDTRIDGADLLVTLWWEAVQAPDRDYVVFLHLLDEQGTLVAQDDRMPAGGASPTTIWQAGDIIRDEHHLQDGFGGQTILIGVYDPHSGERLSATAQGRLMADNIYRVELSP